MPPADAVTEIPPAADSTEALLARERAAFLVAVARVPRARAGERPAPGRWSVAEVVEHVARVERGVAKLIALRAAEPPTATAEERTAGALTPAKAAMVRDRRRGVEAPERVRPTGAVPLDAALAQHAAARAELVAAYRAAPAAALDGHLHPHPVFGPVTLRGWVELAAHHEARHAAQVEEVGAALGA